MLSQNIITLSTREKVINDISSAIYYTEGSTFKTSGLVNLGTKDLPSAIYIYTFQSGTSSFLYNLKNKDMKDTKLKITDSCHFSLMKLETLAL